MADHLFSDAELAALYDPMSPRKVRDDFDFYLPMAMAAGAVLDVGCGTGAMLHEARDAGHSGRLCGLDPAPGMLAQARKRMDIEWVEADLSAPRFRQEFDLVVMTGHAFQVLVSDEELRAGLATVHAALTPGGRFAFETRNPGTRAWEGWTIDRPNRAPVGRGPAVTMTRDVTAPFDSRTVSFRHTFTSPAWDAPRNSHSTLRFLDAAQLAQFLAEAGFTIEAQYGDFDRSPLTATSPEVVVIARADAGG
jgi:ubiquinone/menaquinone biosynthesis C-methylase UbiE